MDLSDFEKKYIVEKNGSMLCYNIPVERSIVFDDDGNIEVAAFKIRNDGNFIGPCTVFYSNGRVKETYVYTRDSLGISVVDGEYNRYRLDGSLLGKSFFSKGKKMA
jgi:antitoxin component YwqK of YwqJK toxin-antitoxin module